MSHIYRICSKCGVRWNVSRIEPGEKKYICPACQRAKKEETK